MWPPNICSTVAFPFLLRKPPNTVTGDVLRASNWRFQSFAQPLQNCSQYLKIKKYLNIVLRTTIIAITHESSSFCTFKDSCTATYENLAWSFYTTRAQEVWNRILQLKNYWTSGACKLRSSKRNFWLYRIPYVGEGFHSSAMSLVSLTCMYSILLLWLQVRYLIL